MISPSLVACRCTAGGASSEHRHSGGNHPQGSKLAPCTCTATEAEQTLLHSGRDREKISLLAFYAKVAPEAWDGCWCGFWLLGRQGREEKLGRDSDNKHQ